MVRTELVGRQRELDVLGECLAAALTGDPRLVVCRGEPGIGKTRLAEEMAARATGEGVPVVWGRGVESDGAPPYWPWRQLLRATAEVVDVAGLAHEHRLTADVSRLAPDVFPPNRQTADQGSSEDRFRQFDAILANLLREPVTREMHLTGLPAPAVGQHLSLVVGHDVSDEEAEEIHALTRGNPFFIGEIGRVLDFRRAGARSSLVTASVREAIGARLQRLSPECGRLLQAASIVGRDLPVALVSAVVGLPVGGCLGPLDEAVAAGLVEAGTTPSEHYFVHALIRDAIEAGLPTSERVRPPPSRGGHRGDLRRPPRTASVRYRPPLGRSRRGG